MTAPRLRPLRFGAIIAAAIAAWLVPPAAASPPPAAAPPQPRILEVGPLTEWSRSGADLPPGSVIHLPKGIHRPAVLEGLRGSAEAPIRIRSAGGTEGGMIAGGEIGLHLRDCRHVVVERIGVIGPATAAMRLEDCEEIELTELLLARMSRRSASIGIDAAGSRGVRIERVRIDGWSDAAIALEAVAGASLRRIELLAMREWPNRDGLRIGAGCEGIEAAEIVARGVPRPIVVDGGASPPREVRIRDSHLLGAEQAFTLGSGLAVILERSTISDPRVVYAIAPLPADDRDDGDQKDEVAVAPPRRQVELRGNLVAWSPGAMAAWSRLAEGATPRGVRLGENWWWSEELPEAIPLLGERHAESEAPQRFGGDPRLDDAGVPRLPEAAAFGRPAS